MYMSLFLSLYLSLSLSFCWSGHGCSSLGSDVSNVTSLQDCSLRVFSKCLCLCICLCNFFVGHVLSSHHSEQMSQRSQKSKNQKWVSESVSDKVTYWAVRWQLIIYLSYWMHEVNRWALYNLIPFQLITYLVYITTLN